jgi:hypothetical protein
MLLRSANLLTTYTSQLRKGGNVDARNKLTEMPGGYFT